MILDHSVFDPCGLAAQNIDFGGVEAKYVVITLKNGREGTYARGNLGLDNMDFGLSEVRFRGYPAPAFCGDFGTEYLDTDVSRDCYVNLIDFAMIADEWLNCSDPANAQCDQYWK